MASLAQAEDTLRSTSAKANFQRLTRLLMCGGLRLLRETFDSIHSPADLPLRLGDPAIQTQLRRARLAIPEWNCLYPSPGVYGKSTDFDITLTFRLLRTICNLTPPPGPRGWDNLPNSSDHSLVADLVRIKYYRNEVYGHSKTMEITDTEFNDLWGKTSEALIRIAAAISHEKKDEWKKSIDDYFHKPLTPAEDRYIEQLNEWYKKDMDVKTEVEKLTEEVKTMKEYMKEGFARQSQRHPPVIINFVVNVTEIFPRTGSSGRPQIPHESGESQGICAISVPGQEGIDNASDCEELQLRDTPTEIHIWTVILSFKKSVELFCQYLGYTLKAFVRHLGVGSLLITVECSSLQILQGLWEDYRSGHLSAIAQEILVTAEVLEKLCLDEVRLKTFISEEEYEKGKQVFMDHSEYRDLDTIVLEDPASPIEKGEDNGDESQKIPDTRTEVQQKGKTRRKKKRQIASRRSGYASLSSEGKETGRAFDLGRRKLAQSGSGKRLKTLPLNPHSVMISPVTSSKGRAFDLERRKLAQYGSGKWLKTLPLDPDSEMVSPVASSEGRAFHFETPMLSQSGSDELLTLKNLSLDVTSTSEQDCRAERKRRRAFKSVTDIVPKCASTMSRTVARSEVDYLERISNLEEENRELRKRLKAVETALLGKKKPSKIQQLEKKNTQLEKRLDACEKAREEKERSYSELQELKHKVDYLEELLNDKGFRSSQEFKLMLHV